MRRCDPRAQQLLCAKNRVRTYAYTVAWRGPSFVIQAAREAAPTATDEVLLWHVRRVGHSDEYGRTRFAVPGQSFGRRRRCRRLYADNYSLCSPACSAILANLLRRRPAAYDIDKLSRR